MEILGLLQHRDVTGADISPSGDVLALACYDDGWSYRYTKKHSQGCNLQEDTFLISNSRNL